MGTQRSDVYEQLKFHLYQDDAVTGEAAGLAMGLTMLGSNSQQAIEDMVSYAQETQVTHPSLSISTLIVVPYIIIIAVSEQFQSSFRAVSEQFFFSGRFTAILASLVRV